jgi:hypothetical protein
MIKALFLKVYFGTNQNNKICNSFGVYPRYAKGKAGLFFLALFNYF